MPNTVPAAEIGLPEDIRANIDRHLDAATLLISGAMMLVRQEEERTDRFMTFEAPVVWEVLFAADSQLCRIREMLDSSDKEA